MNNMRCRMILLAVVTVLLSLSQEARGQGTQGTISGVVKDASGAVLPGVSIKARHLETGIARATISDDAGRYSLPQLALGGYELDAELAGFQTAVRKGITLTVGRELEVNFVLAVGEITEKVEVTGEAPLVETTTAAISGLVDEKAIRDLPLNGRSFDQLVGLQSGSTGFRLGGRSDFSISGSRGSSNRLLMDGTELAGGSQSGGGVSGSGTNCTACGLGVEAIREFSVVTNAFSAEFGKRPGGVVNVATRSGTNELHGSVFEFIRNDNLDARNFFDPGGLPEFKRNNFGASIGGPIFKDRAFFFGNYEGLRQSLGTTSVAIVPDERARQGLLPGRQVQVSETVKPYLALYPLPNGRNNGDGTAEFLSHPVTTLEQNFFLAKIDHRFSEADSIFATYRYSNASNYTPYALATFASSDEERTQLLALQENRVFSPKMLNTVRFGINRQHLPQLNGFTLVNVDPRLSFVEGKGFGQIVIGGVGTGGNTLTNLNTSAGLDETADLRVQASDQLAYTSGAHSVKVGFEVQRMHHNIRGITGSNSPNGVYNFTSLEEFLAGRASNFRVLSGDFNKGERLTFAGFYLQDDFKLRPNLTLNLGMRYEFTTGLSEVNGKLSNFVDTLVDGYRVFNTQPRTGDIWDENNSLKGLAPRIGWAWNVFGDGKTSIRSGFGIFYNQLTDHDVFVQTNVPFLNNFSIDNPVFPRLDLSRSASLTPAPDGVDPRIDVPTTFHYNLMIQREIFPQATVSVAYVGSKGYHLWVGRQGNAAIPTMQSDGRKFFPAGAPRRNPRLGSGRYIDGGSSYHYDSLQMSLEQSFSRGLRFKASYTWSKNIDNASGTTASDQRNSPQQMLDPDDITGDRSLSAFDVRHGFVFNYTYDLPFGGAGGIADKLIAGWQFSGIASLAKGYPFTARAGFNRSRNGDTRTPDRPNLRSGASNSPVLGGPDRYFDISAFELQPAGFFGNGGRNTVIGPGYANFDFALVKVTPVQRISENLAVQFRVEFFNAFNRANFSVPDGLLFNSNGTARSAGARITSTVNTSRQIQFGLKVVF